MQHTEKKALSGYRHHVKAALTALLLCLAGPAAAVDKAEAPAPMLSAPASNGGQSVMTKTAEEAVSINQATAEQLAAAVSGGGLKKAEGLVRYREQNGPFTQVEQLQEVPGIGPALFEKNRTRLKM
ncbi:helix-hairpin-helix domain-containing protein [Serratia marcescens]|nr:helix-hairpin-helix domain-containing protein [Serratia marcescens]